MMDGARHGVKASLCPDFAQARELGDLVPSDCFYSSESWFSVPHPQRRERRFAVICDEAEASAAIALSPSTSARSRRALDTAWRTRLSVAPPDLGIRGRADLHDRPF
jgi:hypothetical protein